MWKVLRVTFSTKTESLKGKSEKAAAQYANASATLAIDMKVEEGARTTYEEGKAVDDAQRNSTMNKLKLRIPTKINQHDIQKTLSKQLF